MKFKIFAIVPPFFSKVFLEPYGSSVAMSASNASLAMVSAGMPLIRDCMFFILCF